MGKVRRRSEEVRREAPEWARRIRDARRNLDWTVERLSLATQGRMSASRISNYEQGLREPSLADFALLGEALGVSAGYLAGLTRLRSLLTQEEIGMIADWRALPERMRDEFRKSIRAKALLERTPADDLQTRFVDRPARFHRTKT